MDPTEKVIEGKCGLSCFFKSLKKIIESSHKNITLKFWKVKRSTDVRDAALVIYYNYDKVDDQWRFIWFEHEFFPQKIQVIPSFPQSSIMAESDYYLGSTNAHSGYSSATK